MWDYLFDPNPTITHLDPLLNLSYTTRMLTISTRLIFYQYDISMKTLPGATRGSNTKILRSLLLLCYLQLNSTIPVIHKFSYAPDHSHILNVVTPLNLYGLLWIVVNISAWRSKQSSGVIWALQRDHNVWIMQLYGFKISAPIKTAQAGITTSPSPSRKGFRFDYLKP